MADGTSTQTAFAVIAGVCALVVALVVVFFSWLRERTMTAQLKDMQHQFDSFKQEMQSEHLKKGMRYSKGAKEFLAQYKKPILQSAFDLQSRLTNQVKNGFLFSFLQQRGGERDRNYALYNFSFVFAEFLGWLEVIRQELVFVTGDNESPLLASLLDGIKFQLTGETPVQGTAPKGKESDPEFELHSRIFQLYAGELRSIGSVMIHTDGDGNKSIINADEFQRLMTVRPPPDSGVSEQAKIDWARSRERLFQDIMLPLFDHLRTMATLPTGEAPTRRLAILQVLLVKLIDLVDNAVPWDAGPKYDPGEDPQYISRDFRLTPLVAHLNSHQRTWLSSQLFMEASERGVADPLWAHHMQGREEWRKLCFCGFREDLAHLPQDERECKPDMWPGACPPRMPCHRPQGYNEHRMGKAERHASIFFRVPAIGAPSMQASQPPQIQKGPAAPPTPPTPPAGVHTMALGGGQQQAGEGQARVGSGSAEALAQSRGQDAGGGAYVALPVLGASGSVGSSHGAAGIEVVSGGGSTPAVTAGDLPALGARASRVGRSGALPPLKALGVSKRNKVEPEHGDALASGAQAQP